MDRANGSTRTLRAATTALVCSCAAPLAALAGEDLIQLTFNGGAHPAWSPDGKQIAFHRWNPSDNIWVIPATGGTATPVPGAVGDEPTWSPDGSHIAFSSGGNICVIPAIGGTATQITFGGGGAPDWSPDGTQIAFESGGIWVIPATGGTATRVSDEGRHPTWSPDGNRIAYEMNGGFGSHTNDLWVIPATGGSTVFFGVGYAPNWSRRLAGAFHGLIACAAPYHEGVWVWWPHEPGDDWPANAIAQGELGWAHDPTWSPDGRHIAFRGNNDIWVIEVRLGSAEVASEQVGGPNATLRQPLAIDEDSWAHVKGRYHE